jgi:hypothetical protein
MTPNDLDRARGHLWARLFGGPGGDRRNIVPLFKPANTEMEQLENKIRGILDNNEASSVFYRVIPAYEEESAIPVAIYVQAVALDDQDRVIRVIDDKRIWNSP